ncbi:MAG: TIGR02757 family protein [Planctomycetes bacterium]|nr:TIGR02757 family protein [Planctomycetota bacterium]
MRANGGGPEGLREALERAARLPREPFLRNDPVQFAHRYPDPGDREVAALIGALLAFGNVRALLPKLEALFQILGPSPRRYALEQLPWRDLGFFRSFRSRVYTGDDLRILFLQLRAILREHATLEDLFVAPGFPPGPERHRMRLVAFAGAFRRLDPSPVTGRRAYPPGYRHLVTDPSRGGASKRWNLFLRWVVRPSDGVDLGLWRRVDPADLVVPLDVHVGRISGLLGLRRRRTPDWEAAREITDGLREIDPRDPLRFDFALSHLGISERCRGRWVGEVCRECAVARICRVGRRGLAREARAAAPVRTGGGRA